MLLQVTSICYHQTSWYLHHHDIFISTCISNSNHEYNTSYFSYFNVSQAALLVSLCLVLDDKICKYDQNDHRYRGGASGVGEGSITSQSTLDELGKTTLQPALHTQEILEPIIPTHSFFDRAKELHQKYEWPEERFENFQRLLTWLKKYPRGDQPSPRRCNYHRFISYVDWWMVRRTPW